MTQPKITFIGAGSSVFMKNIVGDILQREALAGAEIRLMDINPQRLEESEIIANKLVNTLGVAATVKTYSNQREALDAGLLPATEISRPASEAHRAASSSNAG